MRAPYNQKHWEIHPGRNHFFCDGRCVSASNISVLCLSFWLIVITSGLFFAFDCRFMIKYSFLIPVFAVILFIIVLSTLLKTALSDPGVIPRANVSEAEWTESEIAKSMNTSQMDPNRQYIRLKEIEVNGQLIKLKYCTTCKFFRPPRSSHCSVCDNCVERFDHHCPWVGNCIGKRNYRYFFFFNFFLTIYCIYILAVSVSNLALLSIELNSLPEALKTSPSSVVVIVIAFFSMLSVMGLSGFHCNLIWQEVSTNEDLKGSYKKLNIKNPYSHGNGFQNCGWIICGPRQPSLLMSKQNIDLQNLPVGCTYRGPDGCLMGPVGPSKIMNNPSEDNISKNDIVNFQPVQVPQEFKNVNYPRQTYQLYKGGAAATNEVISNSQGKEDVIQESKIPHNYGTIHPSEFNKRD